MQPAAQDVILECTPEIAPDRLVIRYTVTNRSVGDVYVLDTFPSYDSAAKKPIVYPNGYYSCLRQGGIGVYLRGVPPLPPDRNVNVRLIPLGTKLAPTESVKREFTPDWPLREFTPYDPPLPPEEHTEQKISGIVFIVDIMRAKTEGFSAKPAPHGPDLWIVRSTDTATQAEHLNSPFRVPPTSMYMRKGPFSRI